MFRFLTFCSVFLGLSPLVPAHAADEPTEFSKAVTAIAPDWVAEKSRRGLTRLHPAQFNEFADVYLELLPEEAGLGRSSADVLRNHFKGNTYSPNSGDKPVLLETAQETSPGVLLVPHRWSSGFDRTLGFWGVIKTQSDTFIPFRSECREEKPEYDRNYTQASCLQAVSRVFVFLQAGQLRMPEPETPIEVAGYSSSYSNSGLTILNNGSSNGLRKVVLYTAPPRAIPEDQLQAVLRAFSDSIINDDDYANKDPGSIRFVGSTSDPWLRREFPEASEGPSIQMVGSEKTPDGKTVIIGIRCPNEGWTGTCSYGVQQAKVQIKSGKMEARRQKILAANVKPIPANGIKTAQILGIYGEYQFNGTTSYFNANLFLKDGTVTDNISDAPMFLDPAVERKKDPASWGRWRRAGTEMVITWDDGDTDTVPATADNQLVGGRAGMKLNGTFGSISSGGTGFGTGGWVSRNYYTFYPDGTFKNDRSSSFAVSAYLPNGDAGPTQIAAGGSSASNQARYEIQGYMISFTYPDGQVERASFAIRAKDAGKAQPDEVFIGGSSVKLNLEGS